MIAIHANLPEKGQIYSRFFGSNENLTKPIFHTVCFPDVFSILGIKKGLFLAALFQEIRNPES